LSKQNPYWTAEETEKLKQLAGTMSCFQIGQQLGRSKDAVKNKILILDLPRYTASLPVELKTPKKRVRNRYGATPVAPRKKEPMTSPYKNQAARPIRTEAPSRIEWCSTCHAPVSDWIGHEERQGHGRV
jgi:hypothetical protein